MQLPRRSWQWSVAEDLDVTLAVCRAACPNPLTWQKNQNSVTKYELNPLLVLYMAVYCVHLQELVQKCLCSAKWEND